MSPNIIQIRRVQGLNRSCLEELFDGIQFHKIFAPLTPKGVWRLYMASRDEYLQLLRQPYMFGSQLLEITPYYEASLRLPLEQKISPSQIYLYSRSDKLATTEQVLEAIPEISGIHITKRDYEGGNLYVFHIHDRSKFLKVLYLNGSSLNGTTDYAMTFGDDITINNISSNILINVISPYPRDPPKETTAETNINTSTRDKLILPKNFGEFKRMANYGIDCIFYL
ncbi:hypothetical protein RF11_02397 [Thelohanellus kitauei]|uniref:Uncharacterized protein n=1 Tax=Thelohanellus kitauei TaxID=669202 RepID=A0A0C2N579_THEKT|nr:hypothetical protein RF11_02397 [Thelohanellus kitauei]